MATNWEDIRPGTNAENKNRQAPETEREPVIPLILSDITASIEGSIGMANGILYTLCKREPTGPAEFKPECLMDAVKILAENVAVLNDKLKVIAKFLGQG